MTIRYATENALRRNKKLGSTVIIHNAPECPVSVKPLVPFDYPVNAKRCNYCFG